MYCDTSKLSIRQIDKPTAKKMVVKYHYSKLWTKCSVALGLFIDTGKEHSFFDEAEEKMIGVIVYGDPIGRLTGQSISDEIKRTEVLELTRLFIHDGYGSKKKIMKTLKHETLPYPKSRDTNESEIITLEPINENR
jgi:hypothetical protein